MLLKRVSRHLKVMGLTVMLIPVLVPGGCLGVVDPAAEKTLLACLGETSVTVYPAFVRDGQEHRYDAVSAARIAGLLTDRGLADVTLSEAEIPITGGWHMDQSRMFRESTEALGGFVREHPIETDYALLAEHIIGGRGVPVGIHCYVVDAEGTPALGVLLNSHWTEFSSANPQTVDDCTDVLLGVLEDRLETEEPGD